MTKQEKLQKLTELANAFEREAEETRADARDALECRDELHAEAAVLLDCSRRVRGILSVPESHGDAVRATWDEQVDAFDTLVNQAIAGQSDAESYRRLMIMSLGVRVKLSALELLKALSLKGNGHEQLELQE